MGESVCVNLSGPAFSLLLYENVRSEYDQEGFLLGEIISTEKRTITDNDQEVVNMEHVIKINSVVPCPLMAYFYDNCGKINMRKLKQFLGDKANDVVSWYKFKHTPSFKITLREKVILKQLATYFSPKAPEHFLCCLLTTQSGSDTGATHHYSYSQTFIRYNAPVFQSLPMHIINLKDPYDVYKTPQDCSNTFKSLVKVLKIDTKETVGYAIISKIEKALDGHISNVVEELSEAEQKMYALEQEIKKLRKKLTIIHDCGDIDDPFGIMENGDLKPERKLSSSSISDEPSPNITSGTSENNAKAKGPNKTKLTPTRASTRTHRSALKSTSPSTSNNKTTTRSYAQATQKNKT